MTSPPTQLNSKNFIATLLLLQFTLYITVIFDIPIARQAVGFIYFTFIPGFVIVKLLKLDKLDGVETVLFSVGLSIAFLMVLGLVVNDLGSLFGFSHPLSLNPLLITLSVATLILGIAAYARSNDSKPHNRESSSFSPVGLLFVFLPILSIVGAMWVNVYRDNLLLLFAITAIAILFIMSAFSKKLLSQKLYPFVIFMIALSLLYHSSIISNNLVSYGSDVHVENFAFQTTANNAYWSLPSSLEWATGFSRVNAMLSVTILPTVYTSMLNIDSTLMFKVIYPFIFAFVAVALYQLWQMYISKRYAFIAAFLFMAQSTFYTEMFGLNRQMIAELFFVLLLLVVLTKKISPPNRIILFTIFSFALVASHYAIAEIFLFFIVFAFITLIILKRRNSNITLGMIAIFSVIMFTWYIYTSNASVFTSFVEFGDYVYSQLGDLFNLGARDPTILRGLGLEAASTVWNWISRVFAYLTQFLIVVGVIGGLSKRIKVRLGSEYFIFGLAAMGLLVALIVVPGLADTLNMTRFYHVLLFFLAPFCVLGVATLLKFLSHREKKLLVAVVSIIVLVPYFLFQTGFVYEFTGTDSYSLPLSLHRTSALMLYSHHGYLSDQDVISAQWLATNVNYRQTAIYTDMTSRSNILEGYAMLLPGYSNLISNVTQLSKIGMIYLNKLNTVEGTVIGSNLWNITEFLPTLNDMSKVYSNGGSDIYVNPFQ
ncbi:DUF2206 domain-containing protein [Candidatus Bathyarchaeota archaeon]|nr:DUF2206 domain-containing protein [Candidatus Bathyarchaeota archaeon]